MSATTFSLKQLKVRPVDWASLHFTHEAAIRDIDFAGYGQTWGSNLNTRLREQRAFLISATYRRRIVGFEVISLQKAIVASWLMIDRLAVDEEYARLGIGNALLSEAFRSARRLFVGEVRMHVPPLTKKLQRFLEIHSFGFLPRIKRKEAVRTGGVVRHFLAEPELLPSTLSPGGNFAPSWPQINNRLRNKWPTQ